MSSPVFGMCALCAYLIVFERAATPIGAKGTRSEQAAVCTQPYWTLSIESVMTGYISSTRLGLEPLSGR